MGVDLRHSRAENTSRCKFYKRKYNNDNTKLDWETTISGVFYATDKDVFTTQTLQAGSIKKTQTLGTIVTNDDVTKLEVDDKVVYAGSSYIVDSIVRADANEQKQYSNRPMITTDIRLRK
jgi:hypothetical protein